MSVIRLKMVFLSYCQLLKGEVLKNTNPVQSASHLSRALRPNLFQIGSQHKIETSPQFGLLLKYSPDSGLSFM